MKTPIDNLYDLLELVKEDVPDFVFNYVNQMKEQEKQVIIKAYRNGRENEDPLFLHSEGERYYTELFKQTQ